MAETIWHNEQFVL